MPADPRSLSPDHFLATAADIARLEERIDRLSDLIEGIQKNQTIGLLAGANANAATPIGRVQALENRVEALERDDGA